jgi:NHL repeat
MRSVGILLLASLASCDGCTVRNPEVCCASDTECARLGLPPGSASDYGCRQGQVCRDFYCVPEKAPDASEDAPSGPIVENGQRADLVLGQETFTTADVNHGGLSARSLYRPPGIAVDEARRLWILDEGNNRALMWSPTPPTSFAPAVLVVGSSDLTSIGGSCNQSSFSSGFFQLAAKSGKLLVASPLCHRVTIWNPTPTTNGAAASTVLGQASFNEVTYGNGATDLSSPYGVWTDGTRVAVADSGNNRVLIWTSFPITNKQPADIVVGQPGFGTSGSSNPPTGATMFLPSAVYSDGVRLFVADTLNNRVLVWSSFPTINGQPADLVIGQPDLTSNRSGPGASQLKQPEGMTTVGDHLFVADAANNRVLVYSPIPTASGAPASFVLGQPNFDVTSAGTTQETLRSPAGLAVDGNKLYVADHENNRVLRFDLKL